MCLPFSLYRCWTGLFLPGNAKNRQPVPIVKEGFSMADVKLFLLLGTLWIFGVRDMKKHKK